jgi:hypothetical protein
MTRNASHEDRLRKMLKDDSDNINIRVPRKLKKEFFIACLKREIAMTQVIIRAMENFIDESKK